MSFSAVRDIAAHAQVFRASLYGTVYFLLILHADDDSVFYDHLSVYHDACNVLTRR